MKGRAQLEVDVRVLKSERDRLAAARFGSGIERLIHLYAWLREASDPLPGRTVDGGVGRGGFRAPIPGASTFRYRAALRRVDRRVDALASEIEAALSGEQAELPRGRACAGCGRRGRAGARFCDACGESLELVMA